jgi:hypothetical protein
MGRLIRWAIAHGSLTADTTPLGMRAFLRGFMLARERRLSDAEIERRTRPCRPFRRVAS